MTLYRLYRLHRSGGRTRSTALRLAIESIRRDQEVDRIYRQALRRAQTPFVDSQ